MFFNFIFKGVCTCKKKIALSPKRHLFPHGDRVKKWPKTLGIFFRRGPPSRIIFQLFKLSTKAALFDTLRERQQSHYFQKGKAAKRQSFWAGYSWDSRDPDVDIIPDPGPGMSRTKTLCKAPFLLFQTASGWDVPGSGSGRFGFLVGASRDLGTHLGHMEKLSARKLGLSFHSLYLLRVSRISSVELT